MRISEEIKKAYDQRKRFLEEQKPEAYRLLNLEESSLPFAIDIYRDNAVLQLFHPVGSSDITQIRETLEAMLNIRGFFFKNRTRDVMDLPSSASQKIIVTEHGHRFHINLSEYLDTGLFLDHRETRKWIESRSKGKKVLNTFAYTGSFSIYAGAGGAEKTFSVDLSKTYCDWIRQNLQLNGLSEEKNWIYKMDTFEFFKYATRKKLRFDIIIIDPPTFSKNKGKHFSVQKDHPELLSMAYQLLEPGGFIYFSNNCKTFHFDQNRLHALLPAGERPFIQTKECIPDDFPGLKPHHGFIIAKK